MEPIYYIIFGVIIGVFFSWLYATLRFGPLPTPKQMGMIVTQAVKAVNDATYIDGNGPKKASTAIEILRLALAGVGLKLDDKLLGVIVEAVYQYNKLQDKQITQ